MTPEELENTLRTGDLDGCVQLITAASDVDRRAAAPVAQRWLKAAWERYLDRTAVTSVELPSDPKKVERIAKTASAAVAGTGTLSELKALGYRVWHFEEAAWRLLAARRVDWLQSWAEWVLNENARSWEYVRRLVREGLIEKPTSDAYTTAMLGFLWPKSALDFLRGDPDLLEDEVWRLFRVEGGGENSLAARDKYSSDDRSWSYALHTLCREGQLPRERLLDESLGALERDFAQFRAGWYAHFHEALSPTLPERSARMDRYLALLSSPIPPTVSFALKALSLLDKDNLLPGDAFLGHCAPALGAREKGTVKSALRLLERAARRQPELGSAVAALACEALLHEGPDVQEAAFKLIQRFGRASDPELRALIQSRLEDLAASQRPVVEAWLGVEASLSEPPTTEPATALSDLEAHVCALPTDLAELAGVPAALEAARAGSVDLPALTLLASQIPILEADVPPISHLDELIDRFAAILENPDVPIEIERVLDGVSRLAAERPEDFARKTAPLRKRALSLIARREAVAWSGDTRYDLSQVAVAWLCGTVADRVKTDSKDITYFLGARMQEVAQRVAGGQVAPLLGAPTHPGGWINPRVLVERWKSWPKTLPVPRVDAVQALLRIAPEGRAEALSACSDLQGEVADAVRYALGAEGVTIGAETALWIAASRARASRMDDPELEARHPQRGPDTARVARPELRVERRIFKDGEKQYVVFHVTLWVDPPVPQSTSLEIPTALFYVYREIDLPTLRWLSTAWPSGREAWLTRGAWLIGENLDWWEAHWENRVYLEGLLDPDLDLSGMGSVLLALGLAAKEAGESGLATDALIAAIQDGRVSGELLGDRMAYILSLGVDPAPNPERPGGFINASRWAKTLAVAARTSPLHGHVIYQALQRALGSAPSLRPTDLAALLELLHELSVTLGAALTDPGARGYLAGLKTGGKSGKLAQALLALTEKNPLEPARQAAALALAGRIERAERWAKWRGVSIAKPLSVSHS